MICIKNFYLNIDNVMVTIIITIIYNIINSALFRTETLGPDLAPIRG